jgi:hypothetical protein
LGKGSRGQNREAPSPESGEVEGMKTPTHSGRKVAGGRADRQGERNPGKPKEILATSRGLWEGMGNVDWWIDFRRLTQNPRKP